MRPHKVKKVMKAVGVLIGLSLGVFILGYFTKAPWLEKWNFLRSSSSRTSQSANANTKTDSPPPPLQDNSNSLQNSRTVASSDSSQVNIRQSKPPASSPQSPSLAAISKWLESKDPKAKWTLFSSPEGQFTSAFGGLIQVGIQTGTADRKSPLDHANSDKALALSQELAPLLGVDPATLKSSDSTSLPSPRMNGFVITQEFEGYPVFGSQMSLFSRSADGAIFMINNNLQDIRRLETNNTLNPSDPQLTLSLNKYLTERYKTYQIIHINNQPVAYVVGNGQAELAYQAYVRVIEPEIDQQLILLNAASAQVITSQSQIMSH